MSSREPHKGLLSLVVHSSHRELVILEALHQLAEPQESRLEALSRICAENDIDPHESKLEDPPG